MKLSDFPYRAARMGESVLLQWMREPAKRPAELNEGQPEKQGENPASSDSRAFQDPEDGVGKVEAA
jgi:hypothetical protein